MTSLWHSSIAIAAADTQLILLPNKIVWWEEHRALILADTHFGKASTFRKAGLPVPAGTTATMLNKISDEVELRGATKLIVVGDLIHSRVQAVEDYQQDLISWRQRYPKLELLLIRGNHDCCNLKIFRTLEIQVSNNAHVTIGSLDFCHFPELADPNRFTVCGHLHPAIRLQTSIRSERLECFLHSEHKLVLPAFGEFTGRSVIKLGPSHMAHAICGSQMITLTVESMKQGRVFG